VEASKLECVKCRGNFPLDLVNARCPDCDEPLEVRYDLGSITAMNPWKFDMTSVRFRGIGSTHPEKGAFLKNMPLSILT